MELRNHATYYDNQDVDQFYDGGQLLAQTQIHGTGVFTDVPSGSGSLSAIEAMYRSGVTSGCTATTYCPTAQIIRQQMAVFLTRAIHGKRQGVSYVPAIQSSNLQDVSGITFEEFSEKMYLDGIMLACGTDSQQRPLFCPHGTISRASMAGMLLRARYGGNYVPPLSSQTPMFADVPTGHPERAWIEQLAREGITLGCTATTFCPNDAVNREQMALFVARTFHMIPSGNDAQFFTYFGVTDIVNPPTTSITETGAHVNLVHTLGWGERASSAGRNAIMDKTVLYLKEAKRLGVVRSMPTVDFLLFSSGDDYGQEGPFNLWPKSQIIQELRTFLDKLRDNQLLSRVVAFYIVDEPRETDGVEITEQEVETAAALVRQVMAEYHVTREAKLAVIYEKNKYPAKHSFDWLGFDDYSAGVSIFNPGAAYDSFVSDLTANQRTILVPGGANGSYWTPVFPDAFMNKLTAPGSKAVMIDAFIWSDGAVWPGIRSNGMRVPYCQAGATVRGVPLSVCN